MHIMRDDEYEPLRMRVQFGPRPTIQSEPKEPKVYKRYSTPKEERRRVAELALHYRSTRLASEQTGVGLDTVRRWRLDLLEGRL